LPLLSASSSLLFFFFSVFPSILLPCFLFHLFLFFSPVCPLPLSSALARLLNPHGSVLNFLLLATSPPAILHNLLSTLHLLLLIFVLLLIYFIIFFPLFITIPHSTELARLQNPPGHVLNFLLLSTPPPANWTKVRGNLRPLDQVVGSEGSEMASPANSPSSV